MAKTPKDVAKIVHDKAVKTDNRSARIAKAADYLEAVFDSLIESGDFLNTEDRVMVTADIHRGNLSIDPSGEGEQVQVLLQVKYGFADWRDLRLVIKEKSKGLLTLELILYKPLPTQDLPANADISSLMRIGGRPRQPPPYDGHPIPAFVKAIAERAVAQQGKPFSLDNTPFYPDTYPQDR